MNCTDVEELLGAYALDALPDADAAAVRAHLATCPEHAAKARELRAVADNLNVSVDAVDAPPALRSRVLDAIARQPQDSALMTPTPTATDGGAARNRAPVAAPSNIRRFPTFAFGAVAAALIAVAGGLLAWNIVLQNRLDDRLDPARASAIAPLQSTPSQTGHGAVVYFADKKKALVVGDELAALDPGKTYQLWSLDSEGTPRSIGLMRPDAGGHASAVVDFDSATAMTLAITIEPAGGSAAPTSAPIFTAKS